MIQVRNLSFTYSGSHQRALDDISFAIEKGEIFGFLGPNGAGKSTTQNILIGLLRGFQGEISVFDRDLRSWAGDYYERIGVSFELPNHYSKLTARENLQFFASLYSGETEDPASLLDMVGLIRDADTRVARFSKGMLMLLTFARALLNKPQLIFLDEPTMGLDPTSARRIKEIIRQQQRAGSTIFLTTHNMTVAEELCDRVAFLVDGRIALIDSPRELKIKRGQRRVRVEFRAQGRIQRREFALQDLGDNQEFLSLLRSQSIETLHTQEASLEDIFLQVTGRPLT